jgi:hypothetical protein
VFGFGSAMGLFTEPRVWASKTEFDDRLLNEQQNEENLSQ